MRGEELYFIISKASLCARWYKAFVLSNLQRTCLSDEIIKYNSSSRFKFKNIIHLNASMLYLLVWLQRIHSSSPAS